MNNSQHTGNKIVTKSPPPLPSPTLSIENLKWAFRCQALSQMLRGWGQQQDPGSGAGSQPHHLQRPQLLPSAASLSPSSFSALLPKKIDLIKTYEKNLQTNMCEDYSKSDWNVHGLVILNQAIGLFFFLHSVKLCWVPIFCILCSLQVSVPFFSFFSYFTRNIFYLECYLVTICA